jgi:hypothetical protein
MNVDYVVWGILLVPIVSIVALVTWIRNDWNEEFEDDE